MNYYLYEIKNNLNNMIYVGIRQCKCEIDKDKYMGSGIRIKNAIEKHGVDNFTKTVLETFVDRQSLMDAEKAIVNTDFISRSDTYNIAIGGSQGDTWSCQTDQNKIDYHKSQCEKHNKSKEFRETLSKSTTKRFENKEERDKISNSIKTLHRDPDYRSKFEEGIKNRKFPESWNANVRSCKQTQEYRLKRSVIANSFPTFECQVCGKVIKSKGNYVQHMNAHKKRNEC